MPPGCEIQRVLPRTERGPRQAPGLGLAHTDRAHGEDGTSPGTTAAGIWPRLPGGGSAAHAGSQAGEDPSRVAHEDEPLQGGERERPLGFPLWKATSDYLARKRKERSTRSSAASRTSNAELHSRTLCSAIARFQADAEHEVRARGSPGLQSGSRSR